MNNFLSKVLSSKEYGKFVKLEEKLYKLFLKEIICGRWAVGERLPSYQELSRMSGISRTPIQAVLGRLEKEGYIEKIERKGIFLKTSRPGKYHSIGTVILLVPAKDELDSFNNKRTQSFGIWEIAFIEQTVAELGINVHVLTYTASSNLQENFSIIMQKEDFRGIISMVGANELNSICKDKDIPRVFLGVEDLISTPCVTGRPGRAMYLITKHLISKGHKNIALFISNSMNKTVAMKVIEGHEIAMQEAGLTINIDAIEISRSIQHLDVLAMKGFINEFSNMTALIGSNLLVSQKIVETCDLIDLKIPEQLSICSLQACNMRGNSVEYITGVKYDWESTITTCLMILLGAEKYSGIGHVEFEPIFSIENSVN